MERKRLEKEKITIDFKEKDEKKNLGNPPFAAAADASSSSSWSPSPHMAPLPPVGCSFFKIMMKNFNEVLFIPPKFAQTIGMLENKNVYIGNSNGDTWSVEMSMVDGSLAFEQGWNSFVLDNFLKTGDLVTFKYIGGVLFFARIYGRSSCDNGYLSTKNNPEYTKPEGKKQTKHKEEAETVVDFSGRLNESRKETQGKHGDIIHDNLSRTSNDLLNPKAFEKEFHSRHKDRLKKQDLNSFRTPKVAEVECTKPESKNQIKIKEEVVSAEDIPGQINKAGKDRLGRQEEIVDYSFSRSHNAYQKCSETGRENLIEPCKGPLNPIAFEDNLCGHQKHRLKKQLEKPKNLKRCGTSKLAPVVECASPKSKKQMKSKHEEETTVDSSRKLDKTEEETVAHQGEIVDDSLSVTHSADQECSEASKANLIETCKKPSNMASEEHLYGRTHQKYGLKKHRKKPEHIKRSRTSKVQPVLVERINPKRKKQVKSEGEKLTTEDFLGPINEVGEDSIRKQRETVDKSLSTTYSAHQNSICRMSDLPLVASTSSGRAPHILTESRGHQESPDTIEINSCHLGVVPNAHDKEEESTSLEGSTIPPKTESSGPITMAPYAFKEGKETTSEKNIGLAEDESMKLCDTLTGMVPYVSKDEKEITTLEYGIIPIKTGSMELCDSLTGVVPNAHDKEEESTSIEGSTIPPKTESSGPITMAPYAFKEGKETTSEKNIGLAEDESMKLCDTLTGMVPYVSKDEKEITTLEYGIIPIKTGSMELCDSLTGVVPYAPDKEEESTSLEKCSVLTLVPINSRFSLITPAQSTWLALPEKLSSGRTKIERKMVILRDSSMRMWPVLYHESYKFIGFVGGWEEFSTANNLQQGELCEFEDLRAPECMFHVHIFR